MKPLKWNVLNSSKQSILVLIIEACHRLPTNRRNKNKAKTVIVKFTNRKFVEDACSKNNHEKLKSCNKIELGFAKNTELFFNENLSTYFQHLSWMCRVLKRKKLITGSWFCGGKLYYKVSDTPNLLKLCILVNLIMIFWMLSLNNVISPFSCTFIQTLWHSSISLFPKWCS